MAARRTAALSSIALAFTVFSSSGCGPIEATAVINDAEIAITGARAARAFDLSPYEYVTAELYLEKAREERAYAHFGNAIKYGRKAAQSAREAQSRSMQRSRDGSSETAGESDGSGGSVRTISPGRE